MALQSQTTSVMSGGGMKLRLSSQGMFKDSAGSAAITTQTGKNLAFSTGVWMSAKDSAGNIRVAIHDIVGGGSEWSAGPLQIYNEQSADPNTWNKLYGVSSGDVKYHQMHYKDAGYMASAGISQWPGSLGSPYAQVLAPFVDNEINDQVYSPSNGDYPYLLSDAVLMSIANDRYSTHTLSNSLPLGVELHTTVMSFGPQDSGLKNCVMVRYSVFNRSRRNYSDFRFSGVLGFKIAAQYNEYLGTDVANKTIFAINDTSEATFSGKLLSLGCMAINRSISSTIYFENTGDPVNGLPQVDSHFVRLMNGRWKNGQPMKFGGNGVDASGSTARFIYPYESDPQHIGQLWSDNDRYQPGRRFGVINFDSIELKSGQAANFDLVFFYVEENSFNIKQISENCLKIRRDLNTKKLLGIDDVRRNNSTRVSVYPNPVSSGEKLGIVGNGETQAVLTLIDSKGSRTELGNLDISDNSIILPKEINEGMYMLEIKNLNTIQYLRLIINH